MAKLKIETTYKNKKLKALAKETYRLLGQKDNLMIELVLVSEEEIKELNNQTRGVDSVTDVLSFPTLDGIRGQVLNAEDYPFEKIGKYLHLGSIAVCIKRAEQQALEYGHSTEREITYLILHGILHLFGYDHMTEEDKKEMRSIEKQVIFNLGLQVEEEQ